MISILLVISPLSNIQGKCTLATLVGENIGDIAPSIPALATLGSMTEIGSFLFFVASPKVAKASIVIVSTPIYIL
jgi:hypothetical protein